MQAFAYIDPEPLASASVAQVHGATMVGGGKQVVLKVLKPGVEDVLTTDLNFLYLAVRLLQIASPELERTSITGIIEDIRSSMLDEVRPPRLAPVHSPPARLGLGIVLLRRGRVCQGEHVACTNPARQPASVDERRSPAATGVCSCLDPSGK